MIKSNEKIWWNRGSGVKSFRSARSRLVHAYKSTALHPTGEKRVAVNWNDTIFPSIR